MLTVDTTGLVAERTRVAEPDWHNFHDGSFHYQTLPGPNLAGRLQIMRLVTVCQAGSSG